MSEQKYCYVCQRFVPAGTRKQLETEIDIFKEAGHFDKEEIHKTTVGRISGNTPKQVEEMLTLRFKHYIVGLTRVERRRLKELETKMRRVDLAMAK